MSEAARVAQALEAEGLDMLVLTTGVMAGPRREKTPEGIEHDLVVSYLSRFVILEALAARLKPGARVFVMGFPGTGQKADVTDLNSRRRYGRMRAHAATVAGNEALVLDLAARHPHLSVFGLNPGFVKTGIRAQLFGARWILSLMESLTAPMTRTAEDYVAGILPLLLSPDLAQGRAGVSGRKFDAEERASDLWLGPRPTKWRV